MAPKARATLSPHEVQSALIRYKGRLKKEGVPLIALYLFGSYAKKSSDRGVISMWQLCRNGLERIM